MVFVQVELEEMRRRLREETEASQCTIPQYSVMMCIVGRVGGDAETVTGGDRGLTVHYTSAQYNDVYCR